MSLCPFSPSLTSLFLSLNLSLYLYPSLLSVSLVFLLPPASYYFIIFLFAPPLTSPPCLSRSLSRFLSSSRLPVCN
jgi:hypothetical protein